MGISEGIIGLELGIHRMWYHGYRICTIVHCTSLIPKGSHGPNQAFGVFG